MEIVHEHETPSLRLCACIRIQALDSRATRITLYPSIESESASESSRGTLRGLYSWVTRILMTKSINQWAGCTILFGNKHPGASRDFSLDRKGSAHGFSHRYDLLTVQQPACFCWWVPYCLLKSRKYWCWLSLLFYGFSSLQRVGETLWLKFVWLILQYQRRNNSMLGSADEILPASQTSSVLFTWR